MVYYELCTRQKKIMRQTIVERYSQWKNNKSKTMRYILTTILTFTVVSVFAQCSLSSLFPVEFFNSKFDTELSLRKWDDFNIKLNPYDGSWDKPDYLKGDSVYYTKIETSLNSPCFNSNNIEVRFVFADDKLYGIFLEATYKSDELDQCISDYTKMAIEIQKMFPNYKEVNVKNSYTKEKIGEAYKYYRSAKEKNDSKYTTARLDYGKQGGNYIIEIGYKNFDKVKIDNRGFRS
jgi:hypothetical protein